MNFWLSYRLFFSWVLKVSRAERDGVKETGCSKVGLFWNAWNWATKNESRMDISSFLAIQAYPVADSVAELNTPCCAGYSTYIQKFFSWWSYLLSVSMISYFQGIRLSLSLSLSGPILQLPLSRIAVACLNISPGLKLCLNAREDSNKQHSTALSLSTLNKELLGWKIIFLTVDIASCMCKQASMSHVCMQPLYKLRSSC